MAEHAERLECLDRLSRDIAAPVRAARGGDNWIISETTSPVNYTPMVTATAFGLGTIGVSAMPNPATASISGRASASSSP